MFFETHGTAVLTFVYQYLGGLYFATNLRATCRAARKVIPPPQKTSAATLMLNAMRQKDKDLFLYAGSFFISQRMFYKCIERTFAFAIPLPDMFPFVMWVLEIMPETYKYFIQTCVCKNSAKGIISAQSVLRGINIREPLMYYAAKHRQYDFLRAVTFTDRLTEKEMLEMCKGIGASGDFHRTALMITRGGFTSKMIDALIRSAITHGNYAFLRNIWELSANARMILFESIIIMMGDVEFDLKTPGFVEFYYSLGNPTNDVLVSRKVIVASKSLMHEDQQFAIQQLRGVQLSDVEVDSLMEVGPAHVDYLRFVLTVVRSCPTYQLINADNITRKLTYYLSEPTMIAQMMIYEAVVHINNHLEVSDTRKYIAGPAMHMELFDVRKQYIAGPAIKLALEIDNPVLVRYCVRRVPMKNFSAKTQHRIQKFNI